MLASCRCILVSDSRGGFVSGRILEAESKLKVRDLMRLLEQDGWQLVRTRGSHRQFKHSQKAGTVTVAGKAGVDIPLGTLNAVLKQAGLKK
jgi:predicted RNA binding protein YcfA (HicA-like mRNA interferase family)